MTVTTALGLAKLEGWTKPVAFRCVHCGTWAVEEGQCSTETCCETCFVKKYKHGSGGLIALIAFDVVRHYNQLSNPRRRGKHAKEEAAG